jgi:hypothetical protein
MTPEQLARDHRDLLLLISELHPERIHLDSRCQKMPPPHVLTVECRYDWETDGNRD